MLSSAIERAIKRTDIALGLLFLAGALGCCLYATYLTNIGSKLSPSTLVPPASLFAFALATFLAIRHAGVQVDPVIPVVVLSLSMLGLTFATRLNPYGYGSSKYLVTSITSLALTAVIAVAVKSCGMNTIARLKYVFGALAVALPCLAESLYGSYGRTHWMCLGPIPLNMDTWAILCAIVFAACVLADDDMGLADKVADRLPDWFYDCLPDTFPALIESLLLLMIASIPVVVLFVTGVYIKAIAVLFCITVMLYVHESRRSVIAVPVLVLLVVLTACYLTPYGRAKTYCWLYPQMDPYSCGYVALQSIAAFRRGALLGTGVGLGTPELVPIIQDDHVYVAICEELGLMGGMVVAGLCGLLVAREAELANHTDGTPDALLVVGLTCLTAADALLALGSSAMLLPLPGAAAPYLVPSMNNLLDLGVRLGVLLGLSTPVAAKPKEEPHGPLLAGGHVRLLARLFVLYLSAVVVHVGMVALT